MTTTSPAKKPAAKKPAAASKSAVTQDGVDGAAETKPLGVGRVARVTGPVVDIEFPHDAIPAMYSALKTDIVLEGTTTTITLSRSAPG